jgi:hypothetical protein
MHPDLENDCIQISTTQLGRNSWKRIRPLSCYIIKSGRFYDPASQILKLQALTCHKFLKDPRTADIALDLQSLTRQ